MKYKKGDYVRIRHIAVNESAGGYIFLESMKQYCGTVSKIIELHSWVIRLECTGEKTGWVEEWIEPDYLPEELFEI